MATEVESEAEMAGSESRADVAPKNESAGIAAARKDERRRQMESLYGRRLFVWKEAPTASEARDRRGSAEVAKSSAGAIYSEGGAPSSDKIFKNRASKWESMMGRSG